VQNAADIIPVFSIDGNLRVAGFAYFDDDLVYRHFHGQRKDIGTGCHDIFQGLVADQNADDESSRLAQQALNEVESRLLIPPHLLQLYIAEGKE